MKKRMVMFLLTMLLAGCANNQYERSASQGHYASITTDNLNERLANKEDFVLAISRTTCSHCIHFKKDVLEDYINNHEINYYELVIDKLENIDPIYEIIAEHPYPERFLTEDMDPNAIYTPVFYFITDGEYQETYLGAMDTKTFDELIIKYQLDAKK